ncbi:MAG: hypothetical protein IT195_00845 [Microthrixaceae bacterium]|nr:hypothetical protein [Microthrixaceae bacterium]
MAITKSASSSATSAKRRGWASRAVIRDVEAGSTVDCAFCGERVKFQAKMRNRQVICNVYVKGHWDRVEHFHAECYERAGEPHGAIVGPLDQRRSPSPAAALRQAQAS